MPTHYLVELTERAQSAYDRLSTNLQVRFDEVIGKIEQRGFRIVHAQRITNYERIYFLPLNDRIRIVLQVEGDLIRILDIVNHYQLQRLSRYWGK